MKPHRRRSLVVLAGTLAGGPALHYLVDTAVRSWSLFALAAVVSLGAVAGVVYLERRFAPNGKRRIWVSPWLGGALAGLLVAMLPEDTYSVLLGAATGGLVALALLYRPDMT